MQAFLESLGINLHIAFAQSIVFIVLLVVLWRFLYKPVNAIFKQRQDQIADNLSGAEEQRRQAEALRKEYDAHLARISDEARERLDQAMKDAEVARQRLLDQTHTEIRELHERSQAQLAMDREQLKRELRGEMSDIAVMAASKALRTQLTPNIQSAVIDQVIHELDHSSRPDGPIAH